MGYDSINFKVSVGATPEEQGPCVWADVRVNPTDLQNPAFAWIPLDLTVQNGREEVKEKLWWNGEQMFDNASFRYFRDNAPQVIAKLERALKGRIGVRTVVKGLKNILGSQQTKAPQHHSDDTDRYGADNPGGEYLASVIERHKEPKIAGDGKVKWNIYLSNNRRGVTVAAVNTVPVQAVYHFDLNKLGNKIARCGQGYMSMKTNRPGLQRYVNKAIASWQAARWAQNKADLIEKSKGVASLFPPDDFTSPTIPRSGREVQGTVVGGGMTSVADWEDNAAGESRAVKPGKQKGPSLPDNFTSLSKMQGCALFTLNPRGQQGRYEVAVLDKYEGTWYLDVTLSNADETKVYSLRYDGAKTGTKQPGVAQLLNDHPGVAQSLTDHLNVLSWLLNLIEKEEKKNLTRKKL